MIPIRQFGLHASVPAVIPLHCVKCRRIIKRAIGVKDGTHPRVGHNQPLAICAACRRR